MRKILTILTFLIQLFMSSLTAQNNYPIYVSPTLMPPYTLKLSDYSAMGSQKLMVTVVVNDLDVANLPVKLRLKMETAGVTIENPPTLTTTPIYLDGGSTTLLFGQDLIDNFNINKLLFKGYSKKAYRSSGQLPEGFYRFTVEVLHFHTNKVISNQGTISAWIAIGEPPLLQSPRNDGQLGQYIGMPVTFSWLSSKVGSPMAAGNIQYKLEMWEMRTPGVSPYTVAASIPVFHEYSTHSTFYSFDPASLMLEPGMKYAWRVTASDAGGLVSFEQDGQSEIRTFTYKALCDSVTELKAISTGKKGSFSWTPGSNHTSYNVEVRNQTSGWFSASESFNSKVDFYDLTPGQTYQLRVQSVCNSDPSSVSDFTQWTSLTVSEQESLINEEECPDCACDDNIPEVTLSNFDLRQNLSPGDTLSNKTGTTRFIVRSVEPQGNSTYKGIFYFWAEIWDLKVPCEYWDLQVNTDNVIVNMDYESVYDPSLFFDLDSITNLVNNVLDNAAVLTSDASIKDTIEVDQEYESVFVNAQGELVGVSVDENGNVTEQPLGVSVEETDKTLVQNKDGEEVVVTRNGDVMGVEEYKNTGGGNNRMLRNHNKEKEKNSLAASGMVEFSPGSNQNFGFDAYTDLKTAIQNDYPALKNQYRPPFKSVRSYGTDKVTVSNIEGLTFKNEMGIPAPVSGNQITIRGSSPGMSRALYAYRQNNEEEEIAGKLNILSYDEQPKRVYIVPVNGAQLPDEVTLQNTLNRIYKQAVTSWTVEKKDSISVGFPDGTMTHGGSGVGTYNADQRAIVNQYTQSHQQLEQDAFYLFFVENVQNKGKAIAGYMPLQRQVGFIYGKPNNITIAHELAHGAFNLRHPFSDHQFIAPEGTTHNLMDYDSPKGEELWKYQWDLIHDPQNMLFAWAQDEEEGAMMDLNMSRESIKEVIDLIRENNIAKKKTVDLSLFSLSTGSCINLELTDDFTLEYVEVNIGSGKNLGDQDNPFLCEPLTIKPMGLKSLNIATPPSQEGDFVQIHFNRFDQAVPPRIGIVESESVGVSFIIKEDQKDEFEAYLNNELKANATWVSQFNKTIFGNCSCFRSSCCFYTSQYIVKHSTELYSPNSNQIATMKFPLNNAPLIDMQTPVSIPSGFTLGVAYLDAKLSEGKPVVVGVYYRGRQERQQDRMAEAQELLNVAQVNLDEFNDEITDIGETEGLLRQKEVLKGKVDNAQQNYDRVSQRGPFNTVEPTFHYVVVVGKGYDTEQQREYYRYHEVGTSVQSNGTHNMNRFYVYNDKLMGNQGFSIKEYIVTEVRRHSQSGYDCP